MSDSLVPEVLLGTAFGLLTEVETAATHVLNDFTRILGVRLRWLRQLHVQSLEGAGIPSGLVGAFMGFGRGANQFSQILIVFTSNVGLVCCNDHTFLVSSLGARLC